MSWQGGKETGENGEAVLLFAPTSSTTSSNVNEHGPSSSSIGGLPAYFATDEERVMQCINDMCTGGSKGDASRQSKAPQCQRCRLPMLLVAQVNAPVECQELDRSLYVFGCNKAECWREATQGAANENDKRIAVANRFLVGGGGVVRCLRSQEHSMASTTSDGNADTHTSNAAAICSNNLKTQPDDISGWGVDGEDGDDASENDWGADDWGESSNPSNEDDTMDDLEAMLTACEMKEESKGTKSKGKKNASKTITGDKDGRAQSQVEGPAIGQFTRFALDLYDEPYANQGSAAHHESDGDDDDDAIGTAGASDDKIQKMLSRYLKDEEDQDIVQALGGAASSSTSSAKTGSSSGGGSGGGEKYERLPPEERAFLAFTDRIKRSPEQVLRYAYGGVPMWSVPTHDIGGQKTQKGVKQKGESPKPFPHVKPCPCGRERIFEFEVLPSVLFTLNVDIHAKTYPQSLNSSSQGSSNSTAESSQDGGMEQKMKGGGMDWGALVVYSCPDSCEKSQEEFVVAQSSVDGTPTRREFTSIPAADDSTNEEE